VRGQKRHSKPLLIPQSSHRSRRKTPSARLRRTHRATWKAQGARKSSRRRMKQCHHLNRLRPQRSLRSPRRHLLRLNRLRLRRNRHHLLLGPLHNFTLPYVHVDSSRERHTTLCSATSVELECYKHKETDGSYFGFL